MLQWWVLLLVALAVTSSLGLWLGVQELRGIRQALEEEVRMQREEARGQRREGE